MIDMSQFPAHVQVAIKAIDLPADALRRAEAGRDWLDKNGPLDWRLQMISIFEGKISSSVVMARNDENPLALALRRMKTFKDPSGRVTWATLMGGSLPLMSMPEAERLGFKEKSHHAPENVIIDAYTDCLFLDDAWATVLGNYHIRFGQPVDAYPPELEAVLSLHLARGHRRVAA